MNIKLNDISFSIGGGNNQCCLKHFADWVESKVTRVGEGDEAEELFLGEVEVGTVLTCPECGANNILTEAGEFMWVDPEEFDLVDADEATPAEVVPAAPAA